MVPATLHFSTIVFKANLHKINVPFIVRLLIMPAFQPPNIFHPQRQLCEVGRGNLGQITLSSCASQAPMHEEIIVSIYRLLVSVLYSLRMP